MQLLMVVQDYYPNKQALSRHQVQNSLVEP